MAERGCNCDILLRVCEFQHGEETWLPRGESWLDLPAKWMAWISSLSYKTLNSVSALYYCMRMTTHQVERAFWSG